MTATAARRPLEAVEKMGVHKKVPLAYTEGGLKNRGREFVPELGVTILESHNLGRGEYKYDPEDFMYFTLEGGFPDQITRAAELARQEERQRHGKKGGFMSDPRLPSHLAPSQAEMRIVSDAERAKPARTVALEGSSIAPRRLESSKTDFVSTLSSRDAMERGKSRKFFELKAPLEPVFYHYREAGHGETASITESMHAFRKSDHGRAGFSPDAPLPVVGHPQLLEPPEVYNNYRWSSQSSQSAPGRGRSVYTGNVTFAKHKECMANHLSDLRMIAKANSRSGDRQSEGVAYFRMGIVLDNMDRLSEAVKCYDKHLQCCEMTEDTVGAALALNSLGVDFFLLARAVHGAADPSNVRAQDERARLLNESVTLHRRQAAVTEDPSGQIVAHHNCGLALAELGHADLAVAEHEQELYLATASGSVVDQMVASGELALLSLSAGHADVARMYAESWKNLAEQLGDVRGIMSAHKTLGRLDTVAGDDHAAAEHFQAALGLAEDVSDANETKDVGARLAAVLGNIRMSQHLERVGSTYGSGYAVANDD